MSGNGKSKSIRAQLSHPVIDSDGHWREYGPLAMDYLRVEAGPKLVEKWNSRVRHFGESSFAKLDTQGRRNQRIGQQPWWALVSPSELDTATAFIPRLMHERLPDMGIDFAILYPSASQLFAPYLNDEELRIAGCRALNRYAAEVWAPYADRATPIGVIPMHTPQEAVAELDTLQIARDQGSSVGQFDSSPDSGGSRTRCESSLCLLVRRVGARQ